MEMKHKEQILAKIVENNGILKDIKEYAKYLAIEDRDIMDEP